MIIALLDVIVVDVTVVVVDVVEVVVLGTTKKAISIAAIHEPSITRISSIRSKQIGEYRQDVHLRHLRKIFDKINEEKNRF